MMNEYFIRGFEKVANYGMSTGITAGVGGVGLGAVGAGLGALAGALFKRPKMGAMLGGLLGASGGGIIGFLAAKGRNDAYNRLSVSDKERVDMLYNQLQQAPTSHESDRMWDQMESILGSA